MRRTAAYVLALAAWHRNDLQEAMRWLRRHQPVRDTTDAPGLGPGDLGRAGRPAAGDAGWRARVLRAIEVLQRDQPAVPLFAAVAAYARGILERDADALVAAADFLSRCRGRCSTPRPPRTPATN